MQLQVHTIMLQDLWGLQYLEKSLFFFYLKACILRMISQLLQDCNASERLVDLMHAKVMNSSWITSKTIHTGGVSSQIYHIS